MFEQVLVPSAMSKAKEYVHKAFRKDHGLAKVYVRYSSLSDPHLLRVDIEQYLLDLFDMLYAAVYFRSEH